MTQLKEFVESAGLKKGHIAELAGVAPWDFSRMLRGLIPSDEEKAKIVAVLHELTGKDVTVEQFWPAPVGAQQ